MKIGKFFTWKWKRSRKFLWQLPDRICFWGQKWKLTPVRPMHSVIRKEKSLTWKHLSKIGRTKFSYGQPWNHGRRHSDGNFFFVKFGFSPIKSPNSSRKSIKKKFKSLNQYFILTSFIRSNNFVHRK
jgi:hypothetical protein